MLIKASIVSNTCDIVRLSRYLVKLKIGPDDSAGWKVKGPSKLLLTEELITELNELLIFQWHTNIPILSEPCQ